ncbi:MAG TPA: peptidoglycan-binding domain-containing protein [Methylomirabilota bacterium]|nr:peptidoglycan-binding domain-containing protein [Methylomirabilota bacterium]
MKKFTIAACAIALAVAWTAAPVFAADESMKDKAKDAMDTAKDKVGNAWDKTKEKASEAKDKVKEKVSGKKAGGGDVRTAQQGLKDKGFDPGPIDGRMGPRTKAAITDFQKKENLKVTGRLDKDTKARLMASGTSTSSTATTTPSASPSTTTSAPADTTHGAATTTPPANESSTNEKK